ncbi:MAG: CbiX/SirB N-terminal domain-containing protein [Burkholderiaceae bacterium]|nr:CbiX/SirB N-terminal domain-containing protein [Ideonella sp.]MCC7287060.1 CbiX/SirB N-terminal domain-containing protein [Burkholderiaceae bacterium]
MIDATAPRGLVLFAHGARDPAWAAPFEAVLGRVRLLRPDARVMLAFLEIMLPDLADAAARLVAQGCRQITVVPLFLGTGGHVRRDLPQRLSALKAQYPGVDWLLIEPIGEHAEVIETIARVAAGAATFGS